MVEVTETTVDLRPLYTRIDAAMKDLGLKTPEVGITPMAEALSLIAEGFERVAKELGELCPTFRMRPA